MISYEIFTEIENLPKLWKFEGVFIVLLVVLMLTASILILVISSWAIKIIFLFITIILITTMQFISENCGIKGVRKRLGHKKQPKLIIVTNPRFYLNSESELN